MQQSIEPIEEKTWDEKAAVVGEFVTVCWGVLSGWMMHIAGPMLFITFAAITAQTAPGTGWDKVLFVIIQVSLDVAGTGLVILGNKSNSPRLSHFGWFLVSLTIITVCLVTIDALVAPHKDLVAKIGPITDAITQVLTMVRSIVSVLYVVIMHAEHETSKREARKARALLRAQQAATPAPTQVEEKPQQPVITQVPTPAPQPEPAPTQAPAPAPEQQQDDDQDQDQDEPHTDKLPKPAPRKRATAQQQKPAAPRKKRAVTGEQSRPRTRFTSEIAEELAHLLHTQPDLSQNQIAQHFNVSPNTIKAWTERLEVNA